MVQTRSKCRLLRSNAAATVPEESPQQLPSSSLKANKRKRKKNDDANGGDEAVTTNSIDTAVPDTQVTCDSPGMNLDRSLSISSPPDKKKDNIRVHRSPQSPSFPSHDLSMVFSLEAVDHPLDDNNNNEDERLIASSMAPESSDSEHESFDTNLHLHQQMLIDAFNHEQNEIEHSPLGDINVGTAASVITSSHPIDSWPIEIGDFQWVKTRNDKDCLIMGSFSYIYMSESKKKNVLNLRCQRRDKKCGAVVHLTLDKRLFVDTNNGNHNHSPDRFDMKQKLLNKQINDRIDNEPTPILKIIERVYAEANLTDEEQLNIRLPKTAANTFHKKRSRQYPAHPKTQVFDIPDFYGKNNRGEDFIIYDGNKDRFEGRLLMFSTPKLLSALFNSDVVLCDGTFKCRSLLFQQVYVLMGRYHGETIPLLWCLTSCRTQSVYDAIWKKLKKIAKHMKIEWKMRQCMMDFERAAINSFQESFPDIDLKCCWYHFVQSLWRKVQKIGLTGPYETDPLANTWLKQFMALPLIAKESIGDGLQLLKDTIPFDDNKYHKFIKYFEKEYMKRTSIELWHHGNNDMKTNNSLEGYNFRLFSRFGLHPSIWEFIHFLKAEEALVSHRLTQLGGGSGLTSSTLVYSHMQSRRRAEKDDKHLLNLEHLFSSKSIGLKEYLKSASAMVGKIIGSNTNTNDSDQATADVCFMEQQAEDD